MLLHVAFLYSPKHGVSDIFGDATIQADHAPATADDIDRLRAMVTARLENEPAGLPILLGWQVLGG